MACCCGVVIATVQIMVQALWGRVMDNIWIEEIIYTVSCRPEVSATNKVPLELKCSGLRSLVVQYSVYKLCLKNHPSNCLVEI